MVVSEETNRRWLEQEIASCREVEPRLQREVREAEDALAEAEEERARFEAELAAANSSTSKGEQDG